MLYRYVVCLQAYDENIFISLAQRGTDVRRISKNLLETVLLGRRQMTRKLKDATYGPSLTLCDALITKPLNRANNDSGRLRAPSQENKLNPETDQINTSTDDVAELGTLRVTSNPPFWADVHFSDSIAAPTRSNQPLRFDKHTF